MTEPSTGPAATAPHVSAAFAALRTAGYRVSTSRRLMLETLYAQDEPLTAEQVARRIGGEMGGDVASVYRNLETHERLGLVRHFHLGHSPGLYVRAGAGVSEYLVCASCQAVRAVDPHSLTGVRDEIERAFGWEACFTHDPIVGLCPQCRSAGGPRPVGKPRR